VVQCREDTHVLMLNIIAIKEVLITGVHHEHRRNGDYNCGAKACDFTLNSGGGHLYIVPLCALPS
jgi:hypothetical protein